MVSLKIYFDALSWPPTWSQGADIILNFPLRMSCFTLSLFISILSIQWSKFQLHFFKISIFKAFPHPTPVLFLAIHP